MNCQRQATALLTEVRAKIPWLSGNSLQEKERTIRLQVGRGCVPATKNS